MSKRKLTLKQRRFKDDYLKTGNATEAAARNYDVKDRDVANAIGNENLAKPSIQEAIAEELTIEDMNREWVLKGFKRHAEQKEDKNVSLKAYELTAKTLSMLKEVRENKTDDSIPTTPAERAAERDRLLARLAALHSSERSGRSIPSEPGNTGLRPDNGEAPQGSLPVHSNMEQA